jgi:glycosyltransferase involved in cell wall biosynthesis
MLETPFFTIGVPVYNAEKYLSMCVESILNQSFQDFELILVNDGSKDRSLEICHSFDNDNRVIVIDQENCGVSAATNRILDAARGAYIYLMDNDDEMCEGILEKAYQYLSEKPVDILYGGYYVTPHGGERQLRIFSNHPIENGFSNKEEYMCYELQYGFPTAMWSKFVRKDFWLNSGVRFQTKYDGYQDYDVSCRLMEQAKSVRYVEDVILTWFHPREGSLSTEWSWTMFRNYWRYTSDRVTEVSDYADVSNSIKFAYIRKILRGRSESLWKLIQYPAEAIYELDGFIKPIKKHFRFAYSKDLREAFLYGCIRIFGVMGTRRIIYSGRKIKHCFKMK